MLGTPGALQFVPARKSRLQLILNLCQFARGPLDFLVVRLIETGCRHFLLQLRLLFFQFLDLRALIWVPNNAILVILLFMI